MFEAVLIGAIVLGLVRPSFSPKTVHVVLLPLTFVHYPRRQVVVDPFALSSGFFPLALIVAAVWQDEPTFAARLVASPVTDVLTAILPNLDAMTLALVLNPISFVNCLIVKKEGGHLFKTMLIH